MVYSCAHLAEHVDVERFREDLYRVQGCHAVEVAAVDVHLHHLDFFCQLHMIWTNFCQIPYMWILYQATKGILYH